MIGFLCQELGNLFSPLMHCNTACEKTLFQFTQSFHSEICRIYCIISMLLIWSLRHIPSNVANILSNFESYISLFLCSPGNILQLKPGSYSVTNLQKLHIPHKCPSFWFTPQEVLLTSQNLTDIFPVIQKLFVFADLILWIWSFDALYCIHT